LSKRQLVGALANQHHAPVGTWDGTSDDEQVALGIGLNDLERLDRHALVAHTSSHARTLQHASPRGSRADGARCAGTGGLTVGAWAAAEAMALHDAREALTLRGTNQVHSLTGHEHPNVHDITHRREVAADHLHLAQDREGAEALVLGAAPLRAGSAAPLAGCATRLGLISLGLGRRGSLGRLLAGLLALLLLLELLAPSLIFCLAQRVP